MKATFFLIAAWGLVASTQGELSSGGNNVALAEAVRPLDDGVPEVAVVRLQELLRSGGAGDVVAVKLELAKALLAAGRLAEALQILEQNPLRERAKFVRGQALAAVGRNEEALAIFQNVAAAQHGPQQSAARFEAGQVLRRLGKSEDALAMFRAAARDPRWAVAAHLREAELYLEKGDAAGAKAATDSAAPKTTAEKREKRLLRSRLELLGGRPDKAIKLAELLVSKAEGASRETTVAALFVLADAHLKLGTPETGDDYLEAFISGHPADPDLGRIFAKLEELYWAERKPSRLPLEQWARDPAQPRRGFAHCTLAEIDRRAGRDEEAQRQWEQVRKNPHPALAPALLQYARLLIEQQKYDDAVAVLQATQPFQLDPTLRAELNFEVARASFAQGKFKEAGQIFTHLTAVPREALRPVLFNTAMAWMAAGEEKQLTKASNALYSAGDDGAELKLEQALAQAQHNDPEAAENLRDFVQREPRHPRVAEAHLALAELAYHAQPQRLAEAESELAAARTGNPDSALRERLDYLGVWLADARAADGERVIELANEFLRAYPQSSLDGEVRLKLAETYFRRQDFANAQTQFELLAQAEPDSPLTEKALFLAAQSAASTMAPHALDHALELLAQVIKRNGEFRWAARNEQAAIARRLGKTEDALLLYDAILKADAPVAEKREALCGRADVLVEQNKDLDQAITAYDELASESANQPHWRNQALFKKGVCQEKQTQPDAALATFYSVLESLAPGKTPEFFWFYKAGFNAARLLEGQEKWQSAAAVYDRLVAAAGPRSEEAKARLTRLRLEHFLW